MPLYSPVCAPHSLPGCSLPIEDAGGLDVAEISPPSGRGRSIFLTSPFIDQAESLSRHFEYKRDFLPAALTVAICGAWRLLRITCVVDFLPIAVSFRAAFQISAQIRRKLLQLIPSDVICLIDGPAHEQSSYVAILMGIVGE